MSDFKNTTRTVMGHHHWGGGSIGAGGGTGGTINRLAHGGPVIDKVDTNPGHPEVYPREGNRIDGNSAVQRKEAPTAELAEHGGKTPLTSGYAKGGRPKHFHVHKHYHAKGGLHSVSRSYSATEKAAEKFAAGDHDHDSTEIPAGTPDYKRGGRTQKHVHKNAGGAMYAPGGMVPPVGGGAIASPMGGGAPPGALQALQRRPTGMPVRPQLPMRRPMTMPGPQPLARAKGGEVPMRKVAKAEIGKHVRAPKPRGHGVK